MKISRKLSHLLLAVLLPVAMIAQSLESNLDNLFNEKYSSDGPGATVLVAKDGQVLYRKAYGLANLELGIPMKPENVFELGSITKQFTAVAILMLEEQGKLSIGDKLSKYISDYPEGEKVTIEHLLNHTSGIQSYTDMQSFMSQARVDMTPTELIDVFKNEPMNFQPGEQWRYNNSGYILLGYIIEEVSGMSYEDFVEKNIFEKLGMENSYYGSKTEVIKNRAWGYQPTEGGYQNANYLSMTLPYAAGSLMSTVDDMLKWEQAIHNNTLISESSKQRAFSNSKLNNDNPTYYGYGWSIDEIQGVPTIEHGGGIFGYTTYAVYVPSEDLYAVVLSNSNGNSPTDITIETAAHALGKPYSKVATARLSPPLMQQWEGAYAFPDEVYRYITFENGNLYSQREGSVKMKLMAVGRDEYIFEDSFSGYTFSMENGKKVANFHSRIRKSKGLETDRKPPMEEERNEITLAAEVLEKYVGEYAMEAGFDMTVTLEGQQLKAQLPGQPAVEIFPESETAFFLKVVPAELEFDKAEDGSIAGVTLKQGGQEMKGSRK